MPDPILTQIEQAISSLISGMTVDGGYNYDWGTVNERDVARQTFPSAVVDLAPEERNLDVETGGVWAQAYQNETGFVISVLGELEESPTNNVSPVYEMRWTVNKLLDDLKKLFGTNYSLSGTCDKIEYVLSRRIERKTGDAFRPVLLETEWRVTYTQSRTDPTTPDP